MTQVPYDIIKIPLTTAGQQTITGSQWHFFNLIDALNADGSQALDAALEIAFGKNATAYAPIGINRQFIGPFDQVKVRWSAQSGVTAYLFVAAKNLSGEVLQLISPPAKQLVTSSVGSSLTPSAVSVGTSATLLSAANSQRQSCMIANADAAATLYVGDSTVTTANGMPVPPGGNITIDKNTGAIYGRVAAGTLDARVLEEA
jgi:hypothetical protein